MSRNPFGEDPSPWATGNSSSNPFDNNFENKGGELAFATPQARTLASQQRALASIGCSEQIGVNTLEELVEQGEKLDRAEKRLNQIAELQKDSQKQIGSLNSWWKSWFTKKPSSSSSSSSQLIDAGAQPGKAASNGAAATYLSQNAQSLSSVPHSLSQSSFRSQSIQPRSEFDANMDLMSSGVSRLRDMATVMNQELKAQNQQLDRMDPKLSRVSDTLTSQNRQMNKLLGVKAPR